MVKAYRPTSLSEALLIRKYHDVIIFNGGTDLMVKYRNWTSVAPNFPKDVLYIGQLDELKHIDEKSDNLIFGSAVTYAQLLKHQHISHDLKNLIEQIGSIAIRNIGTLAGNACNASPAGDILPVLYALNANLTLKSADHSRVVAIHDFIEGPGKTNLRSDEIVTEITLKNQTFSHTFYRKVGTRKANAISKVSVFIVADVRDGRMEDIRITIGACGPKVVRVYEAEQLLKGKIVVEIQNIISEVLNIVANKITPIDDVRSTQEYRTKVACNLIETFLVKELIL